MKFPATAAELTDFADEARKRFFREYGDSANSLIIDPVEFGRVPGHESLLATDSQGVQRLRNLRVVFASIPGHPLCAAIINDPFDECESCRGL